MANKEKREKSEYEGYTDQDFRDKEMQFLRLVMDKEGVETETFLSGGREGALITLEHFLRAFTVFISDCVLNDLGWNEEQLCALYQNIFMQFEDDIHLKALFLPKKFFDEEHAKTEAKQAGRRGVH